MKPKATVARVYALAAISAGVITSIEISAQSTPRAPSANVSSSPRVSSGEQEVLTGTTASRESIRGINQAAEAEGTGLALDLVKESFDSLDVNGDSEISESERPVDPYMTEKRFNSLDSNADGVVDQFEFEDFQDRIEDKAESR